MSTTLGGLGGNLHHINTLQNTNAPDFDLDRDVMGMGSATLAAKKFKINLATIIIAALIFLAILAWFDFIQTTFFNVLYAPSIVDNVPSSVKLWYAIFITIFVVLLIIIVIYYAKISI
jgi:hypothetical protein